MEVFFYFFYDNVIEKCIISWKNSENEKRMQKISPILYRHVGQHFINKKK